MKTRLQLLVLALIVATSSLLAETVYLNFYADGTRILHAQVESGNTYTLSDVLDDNSIDEPTGCRGYSFKGWKTGGPVEPGETPMLVTEVKPEANVNLYAVYEDLSVSTNNYVRITSTDELENGAKYLIVCYYKDGGEDQYYALGNRQESYDYNTGTYERHGGSNRLMYDRFYFINSENYRYYPEGGVIAGPQAANIWTLSGTVGNWKWTNNSPYQNTKNVLHIQNTSERGYFSGWNNKWNRTSNAARGEILDNQNNTCTITVTDGNFHFKSGNYYLTYVPDDVTTTEDWFVTRTSETEGYVIYLYKQASPCTSFPSCKPWTVILDAMDGKVNSKDTVHLHEGTGGDGVTLPSATKPTGAACSSWSFAGWHSESPVNPTTTRPTIATTGIYNPTFDGEIMYAVYQAETDVIYYERVTSAAEIVSGGKYLILNHDETLAVSNVWINGSNWSLMPVLSSNGIVDVAPNEMVWTYNGTYFEGSNKPLAHEGNSANYYRLRAAVSPSYYLEQNNNTAYHLWDGGENTIRDNDEYNRYVDYRFYIYRQKTKRSTIYSSYPHCTPYTVKLHGCGGLIEGVEGQFDKNIEEGSAASGVRLPQVTPLCPDEGWSFAGWYVGSDITSTESTEYESDLKPIGFEYHPTQDNEELFAVFKRNIDKYRLVSYPNNMVVGDKYILTYYASADPDDGNVYDWELSSEAYNATSLKGIQGEAPQDEGGYYMEESDPTRIWVLGGTNDAWTFKNVDNDQYLNMSAAGALTTSATATSFVVARPATQTNLQIYYQSGGYYNLLNFDGTKFAADRQTSLSFTYQGNTYYRDNVCFLYRQMKEYTSWPHCEPFTVNFDGCGGNAGAASLTESSPYAGITIPNAYVNSDCAKEGWTFAGWATAPINTETDLLTIDLLSAGVHYRPSKNGATFYAVYQIEDSTYTKISSLEELLMGVNYIITSGNNRAMSNVVYNTNYLTSVSVVPATNVITTKDASILWRAQGSRGALELYNQSSDDYLDLRSAGYAKLSRGTAEDNFRVNYGGNRFLVFSNMSLAGSESAKYLGYNTTTPYYFKTVTPNNDGEYYTDFPELLFYRQNATYNSYPLCVEAVDALKWTVEGSDNYVYVESYLLSGLPEMDGSVGDASSQADGTYKIKYSSSAAPAGSQQPITWDGSTSKLNIPFVVSTAKNIDALNMPTKSEKCDIVVLSGQMLTVNANKEIHNLTLYDNASLVVNTGVTLTVNSLILFTEGDVFTNTNSGQNITFNGTGNIVLKNGEMYHDRRIDENRYYWMTLPFDAQVQQVSYSNLEANGKSPVYRTDFWVKYYNGALRAADVNGSSLATTYWSHVAAKGGDYTIQAGQGYNVGIADQANTTQADGRKHTKRVLRFTMKPGDSWADAEKNSTKVVNVEPSSANDDKNAAHVGWNLVGNPYLHAYAPGDANDIVTGVWEKDDDGYYVITEDATATVPYFTLYNPSAAQGQRYSQVRTSTHTLRPYEAVFVQINSGTQMAFKSAGINRNSAPAYMRAADPDVPFYTGIELRGNNTIDRTGVVLCNEYTPAYEIGADLIKMSNEGALNLYTVNQYEQPLAFNGLSDEDAIAPIPVGVTFPTAGEYTFAFDFDHYDVFGLEVLELIDKAQGTTTDLLMNDYTFVTNTTGTVNDRFQIIVRRAKDVTTDIITPSLSGEGRGEASKFIRNGQLFILRDGKLYNAAGIQVK